jgi:serine/threonine protein phosphatase PrpC
MTSQLKVSVGQFSDRGRKELNQDFHGLCIPDDSQLHLKGIAVAMADGISTSDVSHIASATSVNCFLQDYYCTSDAWSVKKSAYRVLSATNSWLHSQSQHSTYRYDKDKGYVCTLSAIVIKSNTAHIFHVGDTRIYRLDRNGLEQLTHDHRLWLSQDKSYLSRAMGVDAQCELDYQQIRVETGDTFILATDGVYEFIDAKILGNSLAQHADNLGIAAREMVEHAYEQGSPDNLSIQLIRVDELPAQQASEIQQQVDELPLPPILDARMQFDGYTIIREVHASSRSHVYLARDEKTDTQVIVKAPSIDLEGDPAYLERLLTEEWVARRIHSAYVLKAGMQDRKRNYLYTVFEHIEGQTLAQWIVDNPKPDIETVRGIVEQIAKGLRAFHRLEMLHQDLKPDNIMMDASGTVKIIDFGSVSVAGLDETVPDSEQYNLLGTALYTAPEYFLGYIGTPRSELFSLGVITYQMLSGRFPYGTKVARCKTAAAQRKLQYHSVLDDDREIPAWVDAAIRKAVDPNPIKRYEELSEFTYDLRHPNKAFINKTRPPLIERNPLAFWQGLCLALALTIVFLLARSP